MFNRLLVIPPRWCDLPPNGARAYRLPLCQPSPFLRPSLAPHQSQMPSIDLLTPRKPLRVGISGAGPGGLGAALFLSQLNDATDGQLEPNAERKVEVQIFDQATELREVGAVSLLSRATREHRGRSGLCLEAARVPRRSARKYPLTFTPYRLLQGIHLHVNAYSMLDKLGAARQTIDSIGHSGTTQQASRLQHRNGRTLALVHESDWRGKLFACSSISSPTSALTSPPCATHRAAQGAAPR